MHVTLIEVPHLTPIGDRLWLVTHPLVCMSERLKGTLIVPVGYRTDLASVERLPLMYWIAGGRARTAAVGHDFLYTTHMVEDRDVTRAQSDGLFLDIMEACQDPDSAVIRHAMYSAVRSFGWIGWNRRHE